MKLFSGGGFAVTEVELEQTMPFAPSTEDMGKAREELTKAKTNGFLHCLAVFEQDGFDGLWVKADPEDGRKDWGRGDVYLRCIYKDGELVKDPTFPAPLPLKAWKAHGLDCEVRDNQMGYNCGYVLLPEGHPWHGKEYSECLAENCTESYHYDCTLGSRLDVHGGVTFSGEGWSGGWWLGFDCAHLGDAPSPEYQAKQERRGLGRMYSYEDRYWDIEDVARETERLAEQIAAMR